MNGLLVKPGVMVMNSIDECSTPQFSLVKEIFVDSLQRILLGVVVVLTKYYMQHSHCWVVKSTDETEIVVFSGQKLFWPRKLQNEREHYSVTPKCSLSS